MSLAVTVPTISLPRRTRKNVHQSKGGCYTCRARRKKCDERKPWCERCLKASIKCDGYAGHNSSISLNRIDEDGSISENTVVPARLCHSPPTKPTPTRFRALAFELISQDAWPDLILTGSKTWPNTIRQVSSHYDFVNAAATLLGAVYDKIVLRTADVGSINFRTTPRYYEIALAKLRAQINNHPHEVLPTFLAIVMLAAVEVLQYNLENALIHMKGAFALIHRYIEDQSFVSLTPIQELSRPLMQNTDQMSVDICGLAQALDVQIAAYTLADPPQLSPLRIVPVSPDWHAQNTSNVNFIGIQVMSWIHSCLHFARGAALYKYRPRTYVPTEITIEQGRLLARLTEWRSRLRQRYKHTAERELLVLQAHCTSTAIYLSCILNAYESSHDAFDDAFQEIVESIDAGFRHRQSDSVLTTPSNTFRLLVSFAQPLFFTAVKCRNSMIRRKAIRLLQSTGREGPWHSQVHAIVAERIVDIEEQALKQLQVQATNTKSSSSQFGACHIHEQAKVCGCGIETKIRPDGSVKTIIVHISHCVDVDRMINSTSSTWSAAENWIVHPETIEIAGNFRST